MKSKKTHAHLRNQNTKMHFHKRPKIYTHLYMQNQKWSNLTRTKNQKPKKCSDKNSGSNVFTSQSVAVQKNGSPSKILIKNKYFSKISNPPCLTRQAIGTKMSRGRTETKSGISRPYQAFHNLRLVSSRRAYWRTY